MLLPAESTATSLRTGAAPQVAGAGRSQARDWAALHESASHGKVAESSLRERARRVLNVAVALIALVLTLPLTILIGILIKLTSPGPILYTQARVGIDRRSYDRAVPDGKRVVDYGGRLFRIYKFRTMYATPGDAPQRWATRDDPRVTPVGRILRKYRLDELPQLFNVLRGDMNLVGPRPEQPRIFAMLRDRIPNYELRQRVLPGLTGLAQVNQTYDTSTEDVRRKVEFDLRYIARRSAGQDLRIMLQTPLAVLKKSGW